MALTSNDPDSLLAGVITRQQSKFFGKYAGLVTEVGGNPEGLPCCIRAKVPEIYGDEETSPWAKPCSPFAGKNSGFVFLPEVDDNVWIEFEAGDISRPIWSGGWWSTDKRPDPKGDTVRVIATKAGHQIVLDEDADEIVLKHPGGAQITMDADGIVLKMEPCEIRITATEISINKGMVKVTTAGASLVNDAFKIGG